MTNELTQSNEMPAMMQGATIDQGPLLLLQQQVAQLEACRQLGHHYSQTQMVPKQYQGKPEDAAVAIQWGAEIGLAPLQALQNVAVVNGNATLWGDALVALVKGSGVCEYIASDWDEATRTSTVKTRRKGEPEEESRSFSWADAEIAKLSTRDTYKNHPRRMLQNRARSHLLRDVYADILKGFKIREIEEEDNEAYGLDKRAERDITPVKTKSESLNNLIESAPAPAAEAPAALTKEDIETKMVSAESEAELQVIGKSLMNWPNEQEKDELRATFMECIQKLKGQ